MDEFLSLFKGVEGTETIEKLAQKLLVDEMWISTGMYLSTNYEDVLQYFILDEEKCLAYKDRFIIFGRATHSGSSYAFFKTPNTLCCDEWPIVVLGDEGGVVALAKNIYELMRFWTLNSVAPYVNSTDYKSFDLMFEEDLDEENTDYKAWVLSEFDIEPLISIAEAESEIIQPAIDLYQKELDEIFDLESYR